MISYRNFTVVTSSLGIMAVLKAAYRKAGVNDAIENVWFASGPYPFLVATIIEKEAGVNTAHIIQCSRREAKRLIYPFTNKYKGKSTCIFRYEKSFDFMFANDIVEAYRLMYEVFPERVTERYRHISIHRTRIEMDNTFNYLRRVLSNSRHWPILITSIKPAGREVAYFAVVNSISARELIYFNKVKAGHIHGGN